MNQLPLETDLAAAGSAVAQRLNGTPSDEDKAAQEPLERVADGGHYLTFADLFGQK